MVGRVLTVVALGPLDQVECVTILDFVARQRFAVLEDATRIDQALTVGRKVGVF